MKLVFLGLALVAATMLGGTSVQAGFVNGTATFNTTTTTPDFGGTVLDTRVVSDVIKTDGTDDFRRSTLNNPNPIPNGTKWGNFSITSPMNFDPIQSTAFGKFQATSVVSDTLATDPTMRVITLSGAFTAGTLFASTKRDATAANLVVTLTEVDGEFATTVKMTALGVTAVPEPTSVALFGLGALGMVAVRFRRKK